MNTKIQIVQTIEQETNRIVKGWNLYNNGNISYNTTNNNFDVIGAKGDIYKVDIEGEIYDCSCPDHQYRQVICCHIIGTQFYQIGL